MFPPFGYSCLMLLAHCWACCCAFHSAYSHCSSSLSKNACISRSRTPSELCTFPDVTKTHWAYWYIMEATNDHDYTKSGSNELWSSIHN